MTADRTSDLLCLAVEHLQQAIEDSHRGRQAFFDTDNTDTFRLVESELRKAYESLNRLGRTFYKANPSLPEDEIGRIRQILTHDYGTVDRDAIWRIVTADSPRLLRRLSRIRAPRRDLLRAATTGPPAGDVLHGHGTAYWKPILEEEFGRDELYCEHLNSGVAYRVSPCRIHIPTLRCDPRS